MKTFKGITSIFMVACMLVSLVAFDPTYAVAETSSVATATPAEKIDAAIWDTTPDEQGRYLVYISRNAVSDDEIEAEFNKRNEFTLAEYTDETLYRRTVGPSVAVKAGYKYGLFESLSMELGRELYDDNISPFKYELIENYNNFIMNKREVISDLYEAYNNSFSEIHEIEESTVLYEGKYTGSYVMYATKNQIEEISLDSQVTGISRWNVILESEAQAESCEIHSVVETDSTDGTKSSLYNESKGYKGTGIKIGIIEADGGQYDPNAVMLKDIHNKTLFYVSNPGVSPSIHEHATRVTSLIVGQRYERDLTHVYEGIVPLATVYQTSSMSDQYNRSFFNALDLLTDQGVTIINYSGHLGERGYYDERTKEVDAFVKSTGIVFVNSAGNSDDDNYEVTNPGLGYNVITVGNLQTKASGNTNLSAPYSVYAGVPAPNSNILIKGSKYQELPYLTNKPDLVAPGTNLVIPISETDNDARSGTSYSAPIVAGIMAQLFEANEWLMSSPTKAKAVLLAGADHSRNGSLIVSNTGNGMAYEGISLIREKSGVGLVDAKKAMSIALNSDYYSKNLYTDSTALYGEHSMTSISLLANQTVRIVLTYSKPDNATILTTGHSYDVGLKLYNGSSLCATSSYTYSNVEVIEFTAPSTGTYQIKADVEKYIRTSTATTWTISVAWRIK